MVADHDGSATLGERQFANGRDRGSKRERKLDLSVEVDIKRERRG